MRLQTTNEQTVKQTFTKEEDFEQKEKMLVQIQMLREAKKQQMMALSA